MEEEYELLAKLAASTNGSLNGTTDGYGADFIDLAKMALELYEMNKVIGVVVPIVFAILFLGGIIANGLVVYVTIATNRTAKHPIHSIFVLNLAAADVIFLIISAPYWILILVTPTWKLGGFLCTLIPFLTTTAVCASIYTICALAWIRFMALVMPFRFRRSCISTRKAGYFVVLAIWIAGCILSLPYLFYQGLSVQNGGSSCEWLGPPHANDVYAIVKLTANYFFPLVLVTFFYAVVGREVLCYMMHRNSVMNRGSSEEQKECFKSTIVVLSLILAFLICWFPHCLNAAFSLTGYLSETKYAKERFFLDVVSKCSSYAHAFVNPFIYTFASPIFRRSLKSSLRDKVRGCKSQNRFCSNRKNSSGARNRNRSGRDHLNVHYERNGRSDITNATGATSHKTENVLTIGIDPHSTTHVTEITRLASPELSTVRRSNSAVEGMEMEDIETAQSKNGYQPVKNGEI